MNATDRDLLAKIKSGERIAFTRLYDRYWEELYTFAFIRTKDKSISKELLQDLWIKIFENPELIKTDPVGNAKKYLFSKVNYTIIEHYYRKKKLNTIEIPDNKEEILFEINDSEYQEILEEYSTDELFRMINDVVSGLSPTVQKVYDLRVRQNKSVEETATDLGISNKTVRNNLSKAISEIRKELDPKYQSSKNLFYILILFEIFSGTK